MCKQSFGPKPWLFSNPSVQVGSQVNDKPDFTAVAWTGVAASNPPSTSISLQHHHHSLKGNYQNRTLSIDIPLSDMVKETDYHAFVSRADIAKIKDCGFTPFYGNLDTAPLIEQCSIYMEPEITHILNLSSHTSIVGKINEKYLSEECLTGDHPDINKVKPFIFGPGNQR